MDKLKEEIAKKKRLLKENCLINSNKKHFRREELNRIEEQSYQNNELIDTEKEKPKNDKSKTETNKNDSVEIIFPRKEVIRRLRERNEPILMFGESEHDAFLRLKHLELINPDQTKGQVNDFQQAMERVDQEYLNEMLKSDNKNGNLKNKLNDVKIEEMNTTIEEIQDKAKNLGKKDNKEEDSKTICIFFKFILELWAKKLNSRPDDQKALSASRIASVTYTQTQNYLKPLFKQLMKNKVADDIQKHLILICKYMLERNYVKANDTYLQMAIGNAPWPIGVTMVGIHARTGREKIFAQNIAHVLNDETQRKYIQGIKRLITQCQHSFPTDPSRCVEYKAIDI